MSLPMTTLLGILGVFVCGFVYSLLLGPSVELFSVNGHNLYGWTVAILGAMFMVWVYPLVYPRKWWN